jgi:hypothetical protein
MNRRPLWSRVIALGCVLLLQWQAVAASVIDCVHDGAPAGAEIAAAGCPHTPGSAGAGSTDDPPTGHDECPACGLNLCALGAMALLAPGPAMAPAPAAVPAASPETHFYAFSPERWLKPPIPLSG